MKIELICETCGEPFLRGRGEHNRSVKLGRKEFCSHSCSAAYKNPLNPPGTGKSSVCRRAREAWVVLYDCEPRCMICERQPADIHHIDMNRENNAAENLQALCRSHHVALHNAAGDTGKGTWYP